MRTYRQSMSASGQRHEDFDFPSGSWPWQSVIQWLAAVAKEWQNCIQWAQQGRDMSYFYVGNPSNISAHGIALHSSNQMENVKTISILVLRFTSHDSWKLNTSIVATDHCHGFWTLDAGDEEKNSTLCIYSPSRTNASDLSSTGGGEISYVKQYFLTCCCVCVT